MDSPSQKRIPEDSTYSVGCAVLVKMQISLLLCSTNVQISLFAKSQISKGASVFQGYFIALKSMI